MAAIYATSMEGVVRLFAGVRERAGPGELRLGLGGGCAESGAPPVVSAAPPPHRAAARRACGEASDTLKERVPLWKKEVCEGGEGWSGRGAWGWGAYRIDPKRPRVNSHRDR